MMNKKKLELYVHIPFCVRKCAYCDFLSFPGNAGARDAYVKQLLEEIRSQGACFQEYEVITVFIGGGTPSILEESEIGAILEAIYEGFSVAEGAEITIEANPGTVTVEKLESYRHSGINRVSLGLQSADDVELRRLGRIHTYDDFLKSYQRVRMAGFSNVNVDLMSALPGQTVESWKTTLKKVAMLKPEHISAYSLIIEAGTPYYERYGDREGGGQGADATEPGMSREDEGMSPSGMSREDARMSPSGMSREDARMSPSGMSREDAGPSPSGMSREGAGPSPSGMSREGAGPSPSGMSRKEEPADNVSPSEAEPAAVSVGGEDRAAVRRSALQKLPELPDEDTEREMYELTRSFLGELGYARYEISNYARPGYECRHNIGYWTGVEYLGLGLGASSYMGGCRFHNEALMENYMKADFAVSPDFEDMLRQDLEILTTQAKMEEFMFLGLRLMKGVSGQEFAACFGQNLWEVYGGVIQKLQADGLLEFSGEDIRLTERGVDISNYVMSWFLLDG